MCLHSLKEDGNRDPLLQVLRATSSWLVRVELVRGKSINAIGSIWTTAQKNGFSVHIFLNC
jgi:hypothetical protein